MIKYIRNIISVFSAFLILAGGNFAFALAHIDCFISSGVHITCEMECCKENPCKEDETGGVIEIADESNSCCKTHISEALTGDIPFTLLSNNTDNLKSFISGTGYDHFFSEVNGSSLIIQNHNTANLLLITSVLRI